MDITDLLKPEDVLCGVAARSRKHALEIASEQLVGTAGPVTPAEVFDTLASRERLGCTAIGHGVAIPHGRLPGIGATRAAFLRLADAVDFEAPDGEPVDMILALLLPAEGAGEDHSRQLGALARLISDPGLRHRLHTAHDAQEIHELLTGEAPRRSAAG